MHGTGVGSGVATHVHRVARMVWYGGRRLMGMVDAATRIDLNSDSAR